MTMEDLFEKIPELTYIEKRDEDNRRGIKSFVLRGQKLKDNQIEVLKNHFYDHAVIFKEEKIDFHTLFGNDNPVVIEIGFGMGDSTARIAAANPDINYLGIEVFLYGFSKLMLSIENKGLKNVKIMRFDAVQVLEYMIENDSVSGFHIFFPDPWPKKRHHKKRLIQSAFTSLLTSKLKKGGYIYCVTDWEDYAQQMLEVLTSTEGLHNVYKDFAEPVEWRPETNFERKGIEQEHIIRELWFEK